MSWFEESVTFSTWVVSRLEIIRNTCGLSSIGEMTREVVKK
jgi:hypothetical protein